MLNADAMKIREIVEKAMDWTPENDLDEIREEADRKRNPEPEIVRKCCRECIFLNLDETCENFQLPHIMGIVTKKLPNLPESIPVPRQVNESMYCEGWLERELAKLLLLGTPPGVIAWGRRHPRIEIPPNGLGNFSKWLNSVCRVIERREQL